MPHTHIGTPAPGRVSEQHLDELIRGKDCAAKELRAFVVSAKVLGRRIEQTVTATSTGAAQDIAFDELALPCASVRPA